VQEIQLFHQEIKINGREKTGTVEILQILQKAYLAQRRQKGVVRESFITKRGSKGFFLLVLQSEGLDIAKRKIRINVEFDIEPSVP